MRTLIVIFLVGCSGTPSLIPSNAPYWVGDGSRAVQNDEGKNLRAVGVATNIAAEGPLRQAAETRAKAELTRVVEGYAAALSPAAKDSNALPSPESLQVFVSTVAAKATLKEQWKDDDGTLYVLLELPLDTLKKTAAASPDLGPHYLLLDTQAADAFERYVDIGKAALAQKAKLPEGSCVKALRFSDTPKTHPQCGPIRLATYPGWLVYACAGGKAEARFGELSLGGTIDAEKKVNLSFGPAAMYQKGCTYKQTERLKGSIKDGLRYEREGELMSPSTDEDCPESCNIESKVAIQ